jgi:hypothetical protein
MLRLLPQARTPLAFALALLCTYGAYELVLLAATPFLGGASSFAPAIIGRRLLKCRLADWPRCGLRDRDCSIQFAPIVRSLKRQAK